ncbi:MAG: hypothetical protein B6U88_02645 [Candidatus Aenigmarchaeota archaeon ex4484_56]|nr:MAG: hypothetical protein B6U88_02645 [Candidatus Aenigmarchaeota archaeon ex4484_56]
MKPKISIFIPIYKESPYISRLLETLSKQKIKKEIFVVIDEPTKDMLKLLSKQKINLKINKKRVGKAKALNDAVKYGSSDILLFLDSDIEIRDDNFLEKVVEEIKEVDILDIKKHVIKDSPIAKMIYYEFIGTNIGSYVSYNFTKRCPSINGCAFAIKRKIFIKVNGFRNVIYEDMDIAMRVFIKDAKFKYTSKIEVYNHTHKDIRKWFIQKKRWNFNKIMWLKESYHYLFTKDLKKRIIYIPTTLLLFPPVLFIILLLIQNPILLPIRILSSYLLSLIIFLCIYYLFSKKLNFEFKFTEFLIYFSIYSFLNFGHFLTITIFGLLIKKNKNFINDWKI